MCGAIRHNFWKSTLQTTDFTDRDAKLCVVSHEEKKSPTCVGETLLKETICSRGGPHDYHWPPHDYQYSFNVDILAAALPQNSLSASQMGASEST